MVFCAKLSGSGTLSVPRILPETCLSKVSSHLKKPEHKISESHIALCWRYQGSNVSASPGYACRGRSEWCAEQGAKALCDFSTSAAYLAEGVADPPNTHLDYTRADSISTIGSTMVKPGVSMVDGWCSREIWALML